MSDDHHLSGISMDAQVSMQSGPTKKSMKRPEVPHLKFSKEVSRKRGTNKLKMGCYEKRRSLKRLALEECCSISEKWENLDSNMLREILSRVPTRDLFWNASAVCLSWEAACWDFLFWSRNVLDLSMITGGIVDLFSVVFFGLLPKLNSARLTSPEKYNQMANNLMRKLWHIMEGDNICGHSLQSWRLSIQTIILPYDLEIEDAHLLYIAERTPYLKQISLLGSSRITLTGFAKAIQNWKILKDIHLGPLSNDLTTAHFIQEIGRSCQELEILHIHQPGFKIDSQNAMVIANSLPELKKLEFESCNMFARGITTFFQTCLQLEEIYFNRCPTTIGIDHPRNFRLSWSVDSEGYAKWKLKPYSGAFYFEPTIYEEIRAEMQSEFDNWMTSWVCIPRRQSLSQ